MVDVESTVRRESHLITLPTEKALALPIVPTRLPSTAYTFDVE